MRGETREKMKEELSFTRVLIDLASNIATVEGGGGG